MAEVTKAEKESHSVHIIRNIIIGVVTTVLASFIIYKIQNPRKEDYKKRREATITAWNSFIANKKIYYENLNNIAHLEKDDKTTSEDVKSNTYHEINATIASLENIGKTPDLDSRFVTVLELFKGQIKDVDILLHKYNDDLEAYAKRVEDSALMNLYPVKNVNQLSEVISKSIDNYSDARSDTLGFRVASVMGRDSTRMRNTISELSKAYGYNFPE